ncbi:MAG: MATE family efflux transporter [Clostridia bacterium]|nr:MATE family efflux transporter [Clostridia bacterium]
MKKDKTIDMTKGSIWRHIIMFSIPMIIGNVFQQLYNMADTIIVGRTLGMNALAAVGACGSLVFLIIGFASGLTNGFVIMTSQRFGAGDLKGVRRSVGTGGIISIVFAALLTTVCVLGSRWILEIMNTPAEIMKDAYEYLVVICWGIPATMLYNYLSSIMRALGNSKTPLIFLLIASVLNIVLDFVCILVFKMGAMGAAVATVVSQGISGILCLLYIVKFFPTLHLQKEDWKLERGFTWAHLRLGIPMGTQMAVIASGAIAVQASLNGFGTVVVAGFTASIRIEQLVSQIMLSLGMTLATFVGQNYGARNLARIKKGVSITCILMAVLAVVGATLIIVFGRYLTLIFIDANEKNVEDVIRYACDFMTVTACFLPALGSIFIFRNTLQGIGQTGIVLAGSLVELGIRLACAFLLAVPFGYMGVAFAGPLAWLGAAVMLVFAFLFAARRLNREMTVME